MGKERHCCPDQTQSRRIRRSRRRLTVSAPAPHSVANRGTSLCALGFPLATPVLYGASAKPCVSSPPLSTLDTAPAPAPVPATSPLVRSCPFVRSTYYDGTETHEFHCQRNCTPSAMPAKIDLASANRSASADRSSHSTTDITAALTLPQSPVHPDKDLSQSPRRIHHYSGRQRLSAGTGGTRHRCRRAARGDARCIVGLARYTYVRFLRLG